MKAVTLSRSLAAEGTHVASHLTLLPKAFVMLDPKLANPQRILAMLSWISLANVCTAWKSQKQ